MFKKPALFLIKIYQKTFSPDHGPLKARYRHGFCRYNPSCSQYSYQAVERFGVFRGLLLGSWRIVRCNPWSKGGNDPVPQSFGFKNKSK